MLLGRIIKEASNRGGQIGVRVKGQPRLKAIALNTWGIKKVGLLIITGELITGWFEGVRVCDKVGLRSESVG